MVINPTLMADNPLARSPMFSGHVIPELLSYGLLKRIRVGISDVGSIALPYVMFNPKSGRIGEAQDYISTLNPDAEEPIAGEPTLNPLHVLKQHHLTSTGGIVEPRIEN
jgi:hypothetical protein